MSILIAVLALSRADAATAEPVDRWRSEIAAASSRFGLPEAWIRQVMRAESGGLTLLKGRAIVSRAGAMGLMQLMPGTWREMRSALGLGANPQDPRDNIVAGTAYLRLMYDRFGYPGLFAAYNAGPRRYAAFLAGERRLPAETRAYVAAVAPAAALPATAPRFPARLFAIAPAQVGATVRDGRLAPPAQASLFVALGPRPR